MNKYSLLTFLLFIFVIKTAYSQNNQLITSITSASIEIENSNPESAFIDNPELKNVFQNVKIFGFGEATHGTKEFFDLKHKFFKYLVNNYNLKIFAIEANFGDCLAINSYIRKGEGNPKELLSKINYWIWNTDEMLSLIEWMRLYNSNKIPEEQLSFYGIDVMNCENSAALLKEYLQNNTVSNSQKYIDVLNKYISKKESEELNKQDLKEHFLILKELELNLKNLGNLYSWQLNNSILEFISMKIDFSQSLRDKLMFDNVDWLVKNNDVDNKIFVWSHNFHINKYKIPFTNDFSMGYYLKEKYLNEYYSIGFDFGSGKFNAFDIKTKKIQKYLIEEPLKKSSTEIFNKCAYNIFFLDLNNKNNSLELENFLTSKVFYRAIGSTYNPKMIEKGKLIDTFDGIIFVKNTNESSLIEK